jgi:Tfp pilus assembly protein PilO
MTQIRQWSLLAVAAVLVVVLAGWFLLISPQSSHAKSLQSDAAAQEQTNLSLRSTLARLTAQAEQVTVDQARLAAISAEMPPTPALASYIRTLTNAAAAAHVDLQTITPGQPTAVGVSRAAPAPVAAPTAGASGTSGTSVTPVRPAVAPAVPLQTINVVLHVNGEYFAIQTFLKKLESMQRVTIVTSVGVSPGAALTAPTTTGSPLPAWRTLDATITATIFSSGASATTGSASSGTAGVPAAPGAPSAVKPSTGPTAATN